MKKIKTKFGSRTAEGYVAVFYNVALDADNKFMGWFDEDYSESLNIKPEQILDEQQPKFSSFKQALHEVLQKNDINPNWNYMWLIYDFGCFADPGYKFTEEDKSLKGVRAKEGAIFIQNFLFTK